MATRGTSVHDFARAPRPCVALRSVQRAQERSRRERKCVIVRRDQGTLPHVLSSYQRGKQEGVRRVGKERLEDWEVRVEDDPFVW